MISVSRIKTIVVYTYYHMMHSMETMIDLFWFSAVSVVVFGYLAVYLSQVSQVAAGLIIVGLLFWEVIRVGQYSISIGMMWDIWSKSFSTLFVTPLSMTEFVLGQGASALIKTGVVFGFVSLLSWALFGFNVLVLGWPIIVYAGLLNLFAVSMGILVMALVFRFGTDIQSFAWSLIYLFQPISAVVYPVEALPESVRWVSLLSPVTYVFEAIRWQLTNESVRWDQLGWSLVINLIYLVVAVGLARWGLRWAKRTGAFARMES